MLYVADFQTYYSSSMSIFDDSHRGIHESADLIARYHVLPPHAYIAACVFTWGLIASLQAITTNFLGMLILRVLLGVSEAAFSPGVPFYLSFFYRREELAFRAGIQVSAAPLAASFAGSLAWLITRLGQEGPLAPWRLLFLVEGFPTVVVAAIAWHIVPDNAETAWFLTPRERQIAKTRLLSQDSTSSRATGKYSSPRGKRIDWKDIYETLRDPKCYLTAVSRTTWTRGTRIDLMDTAYVSQLQHCIQLNASLSSHSHQRNGIFIHPLAGPLGAALPGRFRGCARVSQTV